MAQGKVELCGVNTAKLPILSNQEKEALFARIKAGDEEAKEHAGQQQHTGEQIVTGYGI